MSKPFHNPIFWISIPAYLLILAPLILLTIGALYYLPDVWNHIYNSILYYAYNTLILISLVISLSLIIAVLTSFLIARYNFFGVKIFSFLLLLPLVIPTYIMGYTYVMFFEYQGILQKLLALFKLNMTSFNILNIYMGSLIIALSLFPYIYILLLGTFNKILKNIHEQSSSMSINDYHLFTKIILPLSKPYIITGCLLVIFETISEYGLTYYFGIDSFSVGIIKLWHTFHDIRPSIVLAGVLFYFILILLILGIMFSNKEIFSFNTNNQSTYIKVPLSNWKSLLAFLWCSFIFTLAFLIPIITLLIGGINNLHILNKDLMLSIINTLTLGISATILVIILSMFLVYIAKLLKSNFLNSANFIASLGYAIPGAILGLMVLIIFEALSYYLDLSLKTFWVSIIAIIFAYIIKFIYLPIHHLNHGYMLNKNIHEISISLKGKKLLNIFKIDFFIIAPFILSSTTIVLIDILKELPIVLILKPFNFETISTYIFYLANDQRVVEASIPSLLLILIIIFVLSFLYYPFNKHKYR